MTSLIKAENSCLEITEEVGNKEGDVDQAGGVLSPSKNENVMQTNGVSVDSEAIANIEKSLMNDEPCEDQADDFDNDSLPEVDKKSLKVRIHVLLWPEF